MALLEPDGGGLVHWQSSQVEERGRLASERLEG
jgi:hypothetical protein